MAAFSFPHHPVLLDPVLLPNNSPIIKNMSGLLMDHQIQEGNCLSQFFPSDDCAHGTPFERSCSTKVADLSDHDINNDENSVTKKHIMISTDSSTVVDNNKLESGEQVTQKVTTMDRKRRINRYGSSSNSTQSKVKLVFS